jgi:hypothetical protein
VWHKEEVSLEKFLEKTAYTKGVIGPKSRISKQHVEVLAEVGTRLFPGF